MKTFAKYASSILAEKNNGLTGSQIMNKFIYYSVKFKKKIKYDSHPFQKNGMNMSKENAFAENLNCFSNEEIFFIIDDICSDDEYKENKDFKELMVELHQNYKQYNKIPRENENLDTELIEITKHWLDKYPTAKKQFDEALNNYKLGISDRNVLDGMRLSLEILLRPRLDFLKTNKEL